MADYTKISNEIDSKKGAPNTCTVKFKSLKLLSEKDFKYVKADYVSIVDIDTPFKSMVWYYFKWSFAVIPTMFFWAIVYSILIAMGIIEGYF